MIHMYVMETRVNQHPAKKDDCRDRDITIFPYAPLPYVIN